MLKKLTLAVAALAVSAACIGASSASAATLYTTAAHTTPVAVGSTFTAKMPSWMEGNLWYQYNASGSVLEECADVSVNFKVTQNSLGVFKASPTAQAYPLCNLSQTSFPTKLESLIPLEVSGSSISVGTNSDWLGTKLGMGWARVAPVTSYIAKFSGATGNPPTKGVYIQQPTAAKAPISIMLDHAGAVEDVSTGKTGTTVSAKFNFIGTAAAWSFG